MVSLDADPLYRKTIRRHLVCGWSGLFLFLAMGLVLEALHAMKIELYLDVRNETRRLMWTLAHAHGTLFSLVHLGFAASLGLTGRPAGWLQRLASACLTGALIAMPLGFFLGGVWLHAGDPGLGILLVPFGGSLMLVGVAVTGGSVLRWSLGKAEPVGTPASVASSRRERKRHGSGRHR